MRKTAGAQIAEQITKDSGYINPMEIISQSAKEYVDGLWWCIKHAKKEVECTTECKEVCTQNSALEGDFFVSSLMVVDKAIKFPHPDMAGEWVYPCYRHKWIATKVCPTPTYDQTLYRYDDARGDARFIWVIPDMGTATLLRDNRTIVQEKELLQMVLDFYDETLYRMMKKFNGEAMHSGVALEEK